MNLDYKKLGFKCGIEIHQQLEGKKLFYLRVLEKIPAKEIVINI